jgi:hypothetical protein
VEEGSDGLGKTSACDRPKQELLLARMMQMDHFSAKFTICERLDACMYSRNKGTNSQASSGGRYHAGCVHSHGKRWGQRDVRCEICAIHKPMLHIPDDCGHSLVASQSLVIKRKSVLQVSPKFLRTKLSPSQKLLLTIPSATFIQSQPVVELT